MCPAKVGLLAAAFLALPLAAQPTNAKPREIIADLSQPTSPHSTMPLMAICAGRANEGLRADWQQQLALLQREIGFKYLRFHGLLHDDMGVYTEDGKGRPSYNFQYIDVLYDAMLAQHIRPFVELSFMPASLASGDRTIFWWKANVSPPKDMGKWNGLIRALLQHWRERYGEAEIAQWYYEVWNEPDLPVFWSGTEQQYFDLYRNTAETIKAECARCRVGGPASAMDGLEEHWLTYVAAQHVPADFLSTHAYGATGIKFDENGHAQAMTSDPAQRVRATRELIDKSATPQLELHYTEWNSRYTGDHPLHDQYVNAAFLLDKLRATTGLAKSMAFWTFTDIFEENGPRFRPFSGAFGLITRDGIRKPAFFAYKFLARLGPEDVTTNDHHSWVTKKDDGSVQALFWDYTPGTLSLGQTDAKFYAGELPARSRGQTILKLAGIRNGHYRLMMYAVGYNQNDAYSAYLHMGSPAQLSRGQLEALQASATGAPSETKEVEITTGSWERTFEMQENEAILVTLEPR